MRTPTLDPSFKGLTTWGRGMTGPRQYSARDTTRLSGQDRPASSKARIAAGLFIASAEASTPEWV